MQTYKTDGQYDVTLQWMPGKHGDFYRVKYGEDIRDTINYSDACEYIGQALMHASACAGEFNEYG